MNSIDELIAKMDNVLAELAELRAEVKELRQTTLQTGRFEKSIGHVTLNGSFRSNVRKPWELPRV